jgi:hypothetical protein
LFVPNILLATASLAGLAALGVIPSRGNLKLGGLIVHFLGLSAPPAFVPMPERR